MTSRQHILIVDDEPNVGDGLGIYLRRENYQVSIARTGRRGPWLGDRQRHRGSVSRAHQRSQ